ncbi:MAG: DMT family transporter, partial [Thermotogota bacterium]
MNNKTHSLFILLSGIIILSTAGPVIKLCEEDPIKIAFYRLFFGFLFFLFFFLKDRHKREKSDSLNKTDWLVLLISGISLGLHFFLWIRAFSYTTVAGGVIPILIQPVLVSFLSILFYKEALSKIMLIPLAITSMGIIIMGIGDFQTNTHLGIGDVYSSLGIMMICFYLVGVKRLIVKISPIILNVYLY